MMAKNQQLQRQLADLEQVRAVIRARCEPIERERDKLWQQLEPLRREWETLGEQIAAIETEGGLREISQEIAVLRRGLGAPRGLAAEPGTFGIEESQP